MRRAVALLSVLVLMPWAVSRPGATDTASPTPVVERFLASADVPLTEYRAIRRLEGRNGRFNVAATMTVLTELSPEQGFTYTVLEEHGSDSVRNRAFHPLLEQEREMAEAGSGDRVAFTADNYEMQEGPAPNEGLVSLLVTPRRREVGLIEGSLILAADTADLVRVEGRLAKNPSFWTTRVEFVREYARVNGVRVPMRVESSASIRMAGASSLSMVYEYESVNGRPVAPGAGRLAVASSQ